jgi:polysaccharide deacetylase family protein (PEP-CTERM system associated)
MLATLDRGTCSNTDFTAATYAGLAANKLSPLNAFTVDVEEHFQVEAFKGVIQRHSWAEHTSRVEQNTNVLLELLSRAGVSGTFFMLGWVAERHPNLVRDIQRQGHEIGSHGYAHERATAQSASEFREDVRRSKRLLEDICGTEVRGYRAPTFSIGLESRQAYEILEDQEYRYSSSIYPVAHDLYGSPGAPVVPFRPIGSDFVELPLATVRIRNRNMPCSGGGYFRLLPYSLSRWCIARSVEQRRNPAIFYCHPWEFDAEQPRVAASLKSRFRHYTNINRMRGRVSRLLSDFRWATIQQAFADELAPVAR